MRVAIIGAGLSGICVAVALRRAGVDDFTILEGGEDFGGTWRVNTYPGCACDVPSLLYSYSFAPKPDWGRWFAEQGEIQDYILAVAEHERLAERTLFGATVTRASWDEDERVWRLETTAGPQEADAVIAGAGPWHEPIIPDFPGLGSFAGPVFHSARWDHDLDLTGRRVAVVGSGASAVQFVPRIAPQVEHLTLFQRTPHWVLPKPDRGVWGIERLALRTVPGLQRVLRAGLAETFELFNSAMHHPALMRRLELLGELNIRRGVRDPELRETLRPRYALGCKRVLMANDWYPALARENVTVVPAAVESVSERALTDVAGGVHEADTIILGTGFHILDMPIAKIVHGRGKRSLADVWQGSPRGYLGTVVHGFPNAFVMLGPNAAVNTAATVLMEHQARYIAAAIRTMRRDRLAVADVRRDVQDGYNADVDRRLESTVWNSGGCNSYFIDENGRNGFNYPGTARDFRRRLARFDAGDFDVEPATVAAAAA